MLNEKWMQTFDQLESFTAELERAKSHQAIQEFKSLWRIMKSIQMKFIPDLSEEYVRKLEHMVVRLDIKDVTPTAYTLEETIEVLYGFYTTCSIDPDLF
ncbi:hypothetical protein D9M70_397300 [compost metagenome]